MGHKHVKFGKFLSQVHIIGYALQYIKAKVADRFEAGTDSAIYLKLKNRDTGEECESKMLDVPCKYTHDCDDWKRGDTEKFYRSKFAPCRFFTPSQNGELMFNIKNTGSDDLLLESVYVYFDVLGSLFDGSNYGSGNYSSIMAKDYPILSFTWNGWHWFDNGNQDSWHKFTISEAISRGGT